MLDHRRVPGALCAFSQLFQQALERFGQPSRPVGVHSPGDLAATDEKAREEFWPHYLEVLTRFSKIRGFAIPTMETFTNEVGPRGALYVGSPETVAQKIAANLTALGATRFDLKYGMGGLAHEALMTNIELLAHKSSRVSANCSSDRETRERQRSSRLTRSAEAIPVR